jgi:hypothetical protein
MGIVAAIEDDNLCHRRCSQLARISHGIWEGRGFSPAEGAPRDIPVVLTPRSLWLQAARGEHNRRGGSGPISAGLKPRPSNRGPRLVRNPG